MPHGVGVQDMDVCKAPDARALCLAQKVQIGLEIHIPIAQPVCLPGDAEGGYDKIRPLHETGQRLGAGGFGFDKGIGGQIGRAGCIPDEGGDMPAAPPVFGAQVATQIAGRTGNEGGFHGKCPFSAGKCRSQHEEGMGRWLSWRVLPGYLGACTEVQRQRRHA